MEVSIRRAKWPVRQMIFCARWKRLVLSGTAAWLIRAAVMIYIMKLLGRLKAKGLVYPCDLSRKDWQAAARAGRMVLYNGCCAGLDPQRALHKTPAWRVRVPDEIIGFDDAVVGHYAQIWRTISVISCCCVPTAFGLINWRWWPMMRRKASHAYCARARFAGVHAAPVVAATRFGYARAALCASAAAGEWRGAEMVEANAGTGTGFGRARSFAAAGDGLFRSFRRA